MRHALPAALLLTALAAPTVHAQCTPIPLIFNGDFEIPAITNNTFEPFTPTGWTWVPTNGLIFRGQPAPIWPVAASGSQYVDIGNAGTVVLRQSFTLTRPYSLSVRWIASAATGAVSSPYSATIRSDSGFLSWYQSAAGPYPAGQSWKSEQFTAVVPAGTSLVEFQARGVVGGFDTLIDDVTIEAERQVSTGTITILNPFASAGETCGFSVEPLGDGPLTFVWEIRRVIAGVAGPWSLLSDGVVDGLGTVNGATTSSVTIGNVAPSIQFYLRLYMSNPCNAIFSPTWEFSSTQCNSIDFNRNGVFPEDADVIDFFNVLAGAECPTCNDIDFNNNGVFPEDQDVIDFFNVLAGGTC